MYDVTLDRNVPRATLCGLAYPVALRPAYGGEHAESVDDNQGVWVCSYVQSLVAAVMNLSLMPSDRFTRAYRFE